VQVAVTAAREPATHGRRKNRREESGSCRFSRTKLTMSTRADNGLVCEG
jgi:hypothetical protein